MRTPFQPTQRGKRRTASLLIALAMISAPVRASSPLFLKVPFFPDKTDQCGPATLAGVLTFWGKPVQPAELRQEMYLKKLHGTLPMDLVLTAKTHGLQTEMVRGDLDTLRTELKAGRPVVVMLNNGFSAVPVDHFVIVTGVDDEKKGVLAHSAGKANQFIPFKKFMKVWEKTDYWTLLTRLP